MVWSEEAWCGYWSPAQADLRDEAPDWPHVDMVFHAATNANARNVPAHDLIKGNLRSTQNLLRWMRDRKVPRIVFCSTISAYGDVHAPCVHENTDCINTSVYGKTKLLSENLFREAADSIDCLAVRLPGMLGPNAHGNWLSGVIARIAAGRPVELFNPRGAFNNAAHVSDLFALALNFAAGGFSGYDMVNICAGSEMAVQDLVFRAGLELGKTPDVRIVDARRSSFTISAEKAMRRYGYAPMRLEDMVVRYVRESAEPA